MSENNNKNMQSTIRVMMSPWLGYGHISPYLELAKKLISRDFIIYLCSTPPTLSSIQNNITKKQSQSIKLIPLILPTSQDLPLNLQTTNGLPPHLMPKLKEAFNSAVENFASILTEISPHLLIYDIMQPYAPLLARDRNIPAVYFITSSSASISFITHLYMYPAGVEYPFPKIRHHDYESSDKKRLLENALDPKETEMWLHDLHNSSEIVLIKGFKEMDGKYIDYVSSLVGRKFVLVGPLAEEPNPNKKDSKYDDIFSWLDKNERKSTVFVSFGSEYFLSKEDMDEIAHGLELSGVNFIWVVRFPKGSSNGLLEKTLPKGFVKRVGNRGKVLEGWAPQATILGHQSIGGFVSHCGWNSVMESVHFGVPIIAMPMQLDQPFNARVVADEIGVGVEVLRDGNKKLHGETLAAVIKQVVIEDGGKVVRQRADEMREKLEWKRDEEIDDVVKELVGLCNNISTTTP